MRAPTLELIDAVGAPSPARRSTFSFEVTDVTGTHVLEARDMQRSTPAGAAARALAARMTLPEDVPWILRDDRGGVLQDDLAVGDQVDAGAKLTLAPRAHLGAHRG